ncbi:MAG TPA: M13 family metallopeptidase [Rhizomicrobium sp.]|jgi:putative endopeptidase|nr:M13 family metallopeptidase [Rhizomicrobium sp.]
MTRTIFAVFLLAACTTGALAQSGKPAFGTWGIDLSAMDRSIKPGDDFFLYSNGNWLKTAVIPPDRSSTGSFQDLQILSENRMKEIVTGLEQRNYAGLSPEERKIRDLYDAYMDQAQINKRGLAPVKKNLDYFAAIETYDSVARAMGDQRRGTDSLFGNGVIANPKNSNAYIMTITQNGLGMPTRDYYIRDDKDLAAAREAYRRHLATMLTLIGAENSQARAEAVYQLEYKVAEAHWPQAERRDADKTYNPMSESQLAKFAPDFPWRTFFSAEALAPNGPQGERTVVVRENTAFPQMAKVFRSTPVPVWRDWLMLHYLHNMAAYLPQNLDDEDFNFYGKVLAGEAQQLPRETRAVHLIDQRLGHPLGKLYVAKYFPPASKAKAEELVDNLLKAYDADIRTITWMTEVTKQKALEKLHAFTPHIGYPDKWRDYSGLRIERSDLIGDIERSDVFEWHYRLDRIDQPVDRNEWNMTPSTINAYYTSLFNSIFFPAAILQPPFFDPNADVAVNYGGIGAVIGHEISHGFDDQGSKYTGGGILQSWWTEADRKAFEQRTAALGAQFDSYEPLPGLHVNGKLTMGENIGDLSGITIALKAYRISLGGKPAPVLDGFTGAERFFLSYGQIWRSKYREAAIRQQVLSNPHSPAPFRVIGATRNVDDWYTAFDVKPGDKYYLPPDQRVRLW